MERFTLSQQEQEVFEQASNTVSRMLNESDIGAYTSRCNLLSTAGTSLSISRMELIRFILILDHLAENKCVEMEN